MSGGNEDINYIHLSLTLSSTQGPIWASTFAHEIPKECSSTKATSSMKPIYLAIHNKLWCIPRLKPNSCLARSEWCYPRHMPIYQWKISPQEHIAVFCMLENSAALRQKYEHAWIIAYSGIGYLRFHIDCVGRFRYMKNVDYKLESKTWINFKMSVE